MSPLGYRTVAEHRGQRSRQSVWSKVLLGCGLGCGVLTLLAAVVIAFISWWALTPGTQHPTTRLADQRSTVVAGFIAPEGSELQDVLGKTLRQIQQTSRSDSEYPEGFAWLEELEQLNDARMAGDAVTLIPHDITVSIAPDADDDSVVAAVNFRRFVRPIRSAIMGIAARTTGADGPVIRTVDGHDMLVVEDDFALSFVDGTLVVGTSPGAVERAVVRLPAANEPETQGAVVDAIADLSASWSLFAAADNRDGVLGRVLERLASTGGFAPEPQLVEVLSSDVGFMTCGARLTSNDSVHLEISSRAPTGTSTDLLHEAARGLAGSLVRRLEERGFSVDKSTASHDDTVTVILEIGQLSQAISDWLHALEPSAAPPTPPTAEVAEPATSAQ